MLSTVLGALLPIVVTMLLGFIAAWHHDFDEAGSTLNRTVLLGAMPLGLFTGRVSTRREVLSQDLPLVILLCAAIIGAYAWFPRFSKLPKNLVSAKSILS